MLVHSGSIIIKALGYRSGLKMAFRTKEGFNLRYKVDAFSPHANFPLLYVMIANHYM
jgi:hypothetical protein